MLFWRQKSFPLLPLTFGSVQRWSKEELFVARITQQFVDTPYKTKLFIQFTLKIAHVEVRAELRSFAIEPDLKIQNKC